MTPTPLIHSEAEIFVTDKDKKTKAANSPKTNKKNPNPILILQILNSLHTHIHHINYTLRYQFWCLIRIIETYFIEKFLYHIYLHLSIIKVLLL